MSHGKLRSEKNCLNCGAEVPSVYCPTCGQMNREPKFNLKDLIMDFIRADSEWHVCTKIVDGLPDSKDACFLEVAHEARVSLVTGNGRHYPEELRNGVEVLSPREFIDNIIANI